VDSRSLLPAAGGLLQFSACFWWFLTVCCLFLLVLLLGLIFDLEDGGYVILRNFGLFPTNTALQAHRPL
jgi:hypothetical protein